MQTTLETKRDWDLELARVGLGFSIEINSGPIGVYRDDWPAIQWTVTLKYGIKSVLTTDYRSGIACINPKAMPLHHPTLTHDERSMLDTWKRSPGAKFLDKPLFASLIGKIAKAQSVKPKLVDVVNSCLLDGEAFFNAMTFEQWASELGYDSDSIKAKGVWEACDKTGRSLASNVPKEVLDKARELLTDY